jgi:hypothetical protein
MFVNLLHPWLLCKDFLAGRSDGQGGGIACSRDVSTVSIPGKRVSAIAVRAAERQRGGDRGGRLRKDTGPPRRAEGSGMARGGVTGNGSKAGNQQNQWRLANLLMVHETQVVKTLIALCCRAPRRAYAMLEPERLARSPIRRAHRRSARALGRVRRRAARRSSTGAVPACLHRRTIPRRTVRSSTSVRVPGRVARRGCLRAGARTDNAVFVPAFSSPLAVAQRPRVAARSPISGASLPATQAARLERETPVQSPREVRPPAVERVKGPAARSDSAFSHRCAYPLSVALRPRDAVR